jgi:hypothetical protein
MYDNQIKNFAILDNNGIVVEIKSFSLDSTNSYLGDTSYYAVCIDLLEYQIEVGMKWNNELNKFE